MPDPALIPMKPADAKQLARSIVATGVVTFSGHAMEEMANDDLATPDCLNLIRAGVYGGAEQVNGEWRYRVQTSRMCVVITFVSDTRLRVVTAWRES
ncbi:MAG: hypothetical protein U0163_20560 [Gemmatimonadaceae bacterium]